MAAGETGGHFTLKSFGLVNFPQKLEGLQCPWPCVQLRAMDMNIEQTPNGV